MIMKSRYTHLFHVLLTCIMLLAWSSVQGLSVSGKVTATGTNLPLSGYSVFVVVSETGGQGFNYFTRLTTDTAGNFSDTFFVPPGPQLTMMVMTFDCNMVPQQQNFSVTQQHYVANFQVCGGLSGCHAWFSAHSLHPNPLRTTFRNFSVGEFNTTFWEFGDGNFSQQPEPVYNYSQAGTYVVTLTVSHTSAGLNCLDTYIDTIVVGLPPAPCQAGFNAWANLANPMKWHFQQQATGQITQYLWDFGDGTQANGPNTMHIYDDTGTYQVCLRILGPGCSDTICQTVQVSSPGRFHLAGQVFTGFFPADEAEVMLFRKLEGKYYHVQTTSTDSLGVYYFYQLIGGKYILLAKIKPGTALSGQYLPTYYPSEARWVSADEINLSSNTFNANIILKPYPVIQTGPGQVSGNITFSNASGGGPAPDVEVLLLGQGGQPLAATWSLPDGSYQFSGIKLGHYNVHAEVPGIPSQAVGVVLNASQPVANQVNMEVQPMLVLGIPASTPAVDDVIRLFPNPAQETLYLYIDVAERTGIKGSLTDIHGRLILPVFLDHPGGSHQHHISLDLLRPGTYILTLGWGQGQRLSRKLIRMP